MSISRSSYYRSLVHKEEKEPDYLLFHHNNADSISLIGNIVQKLNLSTLDVETLIDVGYGNRVTAILMKNGSIYVSFDNPDESVRIHEYDTDGNLIKLRGLSSPVRSIGDSDGNVYTGGNRSVSRITTVKRNSDLNVIWSIDHGDTVQSVAVDSSGNVYTVGNRNNNINSTYSTTRKYSPIGTLLWSDDHGVAAGNSVWSVAVDSYGNVYTGGGISVVYDASTTRKYSPTGTLLWSVPHGGSGATVYAVAVDSSGNVYTGGNRNNNINSTYSTTRKYDTNGNLIWSRDHGATVYTVAVDSSGNVYTGGSRNNNINSTYSTTRKYDTNGNLIWSIDNSARVYGITLEDV